MSKLRFYLPAFLLVLFCTFDLSASTPVAPVGTWTAGAVMSTPRSAATATLLPDGRVLLVGGKDAKGQPLASAEVLKSDGTSSPVASMATPRFGHSAILLANGTVLVAGGRTSGGAVVNTAEIFDGSTNTWKPVSGTMVDPRSEFTLSRLPDGTVLVAGGDNGSGALGSIERYDPSTGIFGYDGTMVAARRSHAAVVLQDGRILISGGSTKAQDGSTLALASTEIYDPATHAASAGPALHTGRYAHSATLLIDGTVLLAGGNNGSADLGSVEVFDPVAGTISVSSASLAAPRSGHVALLLPNNNHVLLIGGTSSGADLSSTELYRSWTATMLANPALTTARSAAAGSPMQADGAVVVAGGSNLNSTELYGFATVKTDKLDYAPCTPVQITGSGWQPGETVTLTMVESPDFDEHPALTAIADSLGNIANSDFAPDVHDLGIRFYLTAAGSKSQAQSTFTDKGDISKIVISPDTGVSVAGTNVTFNVGVTSGTTVVNEGCVLITVIDKTVTPNISTSLAPISAGQPISYTFAKAGTFGLRADYSDKPGTCGKVNTGNNFNDSSTPGTASWTVTSNLRINWSNPTSPISYGTPLSGAQLNATATDQNGAAVPGTFSYTPASGTVLSVGTQTLSVHFVPTDTTTYGTPADATVSLTVKPLSLTPAITASNKTYDGTTSATFTCSVTGVLAVDSSSVSCTGGTATFGSAQAGTGITVTATGLSLTGVGAGNYTLASTTATTTANITAKGLTIAGVKASDKVYDGTTAATLNASAATLQGVVGTDQVTLQSASATGSFADKNVGSAKTVTASGYTLSGANAASYTVSQPTGLTASITPKALTVTGITAADKVYDGATNATLTTTGATLVGVISGDTLTLNTSAATGAFADKNVGAGKQVAVAGLAFATPNGNYTLTQPTTTASITAKPLTVAGVTANDKVYDGTRTAALNVSSASLVGVVPNDAVTLATSGATGSFADKNVGASKSVTVAGLALAGTDSANYSLTQPTTSASISAKPVTVLGLTAADKIYDGTTASTLNLAGAQLQGIISGDVASLSTSSVTGAFADKNVGSSKSVTITGLAIGGSDAANYALTQPTATASITPRTISVAGITAVSRTYDGTVSAALNLASAALQGTVSGDSVVPVTTQAAGTFADKNVGAAKPVTIAGITLSGTDAGNYAVTQPTATADITAKALSVVVKANSKTYDGTTAATIASESLTGVIGSDGVSLTGGSATFSDKIAGTGKTVTVTGLSLNGADAANYSISTPVQVTADILQRALHVTATGASKVYDGTAAATVTLHDDRVNGDVLTDAYASATFSDKSVGAGKTITVSGITIAGPDLLNYTLANTTATATADITVRPLTVTATADDKVYEGSNVAVAHLSDNRIAGDSLADAYTAASFSDKSVGAAKPVSVTGISISGVDAGNYSLSSTSATATASISARPLHISATGQSRKYDGTIIATVTLSDDRLPGDTFTEIYTSATFGDKNVGTAKPVNVTGISITGGDSGNYSSNATATTTASIMQRPITVTAAADSKIYDGTLVSLGKPAISGDGLAPGDLASYSQSFDTKIVGSAKLLTATGSVQDGNGGANYQVTLVSSNSGTITPRPLTVSAVAVSKRYDGTTSASVTLSDDRMAGDQFTDTYSAANFSDKNVGTGKAVTVSGIQITGADAANYGPVNSTVLATADIVARALTVTATASNKTYDGNTTAAVQLSDDRLPGDSLTDGYTSATFADKAAGAGKTVSITGIAISGSDAGNYNLANTTAAATASILARHLTVSAAGVDRIYDGTTAATVALSDDRFAGDNFSDSYVSASFADKNVGASKAVTVSGISLSGPDAANYSPNVTATAAASISQRRLIVSATGTAKVYDGTSAATVTLSDDRVGGDLLTDSFTSATYSDKNTGSSKQISVSGISISGVDAANYGPVNSTASTVGDITQRPLTVTASAANRTYDGTTSASVTLSDNRVQGDVLSDAWTSATFSDRNAGTAKSVTVTGISIAGADLANYLLGNTTATATADITARPIEVSAASDSKTYDATATSTKSPSITAGSLATGDSATYNQVFDSRNAGARSLIPSAAITDGNNGSNYSVSFHNATGSISPLAITGSITASDKTYDGTVAANIVTRTLGGVLLNDAVSYAGGSASFSDSNAGPAKLVTGTGLYLAGGDAANYTVNTTAVTTATITKANQSINWTNPAPIVVGTALGSTQLNAAVTAVAGGTAPGQLTYTPGAGTVLGVGSNQLRVDAAGTLNYNPATKTVNITVSYSTAACLGDLGHSILQPINMDGSSTFKQGSTVPAKFRVCDASGHSIGTAGVVTSFNLVQVVNGVVSTSVDEAVVSTTPDTSFRWDATAQQWIFNISTKPLSTQSTYIYAIGLNDGSTIMFRYGLPK